MIPALTPVQFEQLQIFVSSLSRDVTFRAEKLLEDQLENLAYIPEDSSFHAEFTNSVARLLFQNGKWIGRCNCRRYIDCEHICALATRMLEDFAPKDAGAKEPQISAALENLDEKAIE